MWIIAQNGKAYNSSQFQSLRIEIDYTQEIEVTGGSARGEATGQAHIIALPGSINLGTYPVHEVKIRFQTILQNLQAIGIDGGEKWEWD